MHRTSEQKFGQIGRVAFDLSMAIAREKGSFEDFANLYHLSVAGREAARDVRLAKVDFSEDSSESLR